MKITAFSDEQSAGQRLMVGFDGTELNPDLKFLIKTLHVGGIILFTRNLINPDQIKRLCSSIQEYARSCGQPPLFISIDQEGGKVARLNKPFTQFPGNPKMKGPEDAIHFARVTAAELTEIGVNMNLAPVLDVAPQSINSVQASRVFGHDPSWVSELGTVVIDHLQSNNIMAVAKHFPGIGRIILDPHDEISDLDVDADAM
ncbi:MAG: glycoside hydrolase family 3 N-terminal domain-containing protein, partial [Desulfobacterales bacterium]